MTQVVVSYVILTELFKIYVVVFRKIICMSGGEEIPNRYETPVHIVISEFGIELNNKVFSTGVSIQSFL